MDRNDTFSWIAWGLATLGAINWGLRGAANFNLVHAMFGWNPNIERLAYILVGFGGVVSLFRFFEYSQRKTVEHEGFGSRLRRAA